MPYKDILLEANTELEKIDMIDVDLERIQS